MDASLFEEGDLLVGEERELEGCGILEVGGVSWEFHPGRCLSQELSELSEGAGGLHDDIRVIEYHVLYVDNGPVCYELVLLTVFRDPFHSINPSHYNIYTYLSISLVVFRRWSNIPFNWGFILFTIHVIRVLFYVELVHTWLIWARIH